MRAIPGQSALQKTGCRVATFVGKHFDVRKPGRIVDRDVRKFPAGSFDSFRAIAMDAMSDVAGNSCQLFHVQVKELARMLPLVPVGRFRRLEQSESM
jgi:hypothetical protein